jgi:AcrR family transcriptional regulator
MSAARIFHSLTAHIFPTATMPAKPKTSHASSKAPSRRVPSQARAEHTVSVIFEATAQVLNEHGEEALSTNRIAERAGVSIGSLYQYFSSKEAIVLAMLFRERDQMMKKLDALLADADPASGDPGKSDPRHILRAFIRHYIQAFGTGAPGYRRLMRLAWRLDQDQALIHSMREASERIAMHLHRLNHPLLKTPTPAVAFVLTRLLAGTVRSASLEESPLLGTREFEDALVDACWGVMAKQSAAASGAVRKRSTPQPKRRTKAAASSSPQKKK